MNLMLVPSVVSHAVPSSQGELRGSNHQTTVLRMPISPADSGYHNIAQHDPHLNDELHKFYNCTRLSRCRMAFVMKARVHVDVISSLLLTPNVIIDKMAAVEFLEGTQ